MFTLHTQLNTQYNYRRGSQFSLELQHLLRIINKGKSKDKNAQIKEPLTNNYKDKIIMMKLTCCLADFFKVSQSENKNISYLNLILFCN